MKLIVYCALLALTHTVWSDNLLSHVNDQMVVCINNCFTAYGWLMGQGCRARFPLPEHVEVSNNLLISCCLCSSYNEICWILFINIFELHNQHFYFIPQLLIFSYLGSWHTSLSSTYGCWCQHRYEIEQNTFTFVIYCTDKQKFWWTTLTRTHVLWQLQPIHSQPETCYDSLYGSHTRIVCIDS